MDITAVLVAVIAAIASVTGGFFAYKASSRIKTSNGHTSGELLEYIADEVGWLRDQFVEHAKDQAIHRDQATNHLDAIKREQRKRGS